MRWMLALAVLLASAAAQTVEEQAEVTARETAPSFQVRTNLVLVPVVVRDGKGKIVGNLTRENFELLDKGKAQTITRFSVDRADGQASGAGAAGVARAPSTGVAAGSAAAPKRYVAFLFDDVHLTLAHMTYARQAAERYLANAGAASDRFAIYTASGETSVDFTDDRPRLRAALPELRARTKVDLNRRECPNLTYYQADQYIRQNNKTVQDAAMLEAVACSGLDPGTGRDAAAIMEQARAMARAAAQRVLDAGEQETLKSLQAVRVVIRRMTAMPGQRTLVLVSPGFMTAYARRQLDEAVDTAVRGNVVVHALDASGLAVGDPSMDAGAREVDQKQLDLVATAAETADPNPDASVDSQLRGNAASVIAVIHRDALNANREPMVALSDGTGGTHFHNQNDLDLGFERTAGAPEIRYVLGFTPGNLKTDGAFHELKVRLRNGGGATVQARRGYFAPDGTADPAQIARQEIEDALFSREEIHDLSAEVHTLFFKPAPETARLSVVVRIDVKELPFRKAEGRNRDDLTVVSALFDRHGNYVAGAQKVIEMRLKDETLAGEHGPPVTVKSNFDVPPGEYIVRVVVRESEGQKIAARNSVVAIPW